MRGLDEGVKTLLHATRRFHLGVLVVLIRQGR